MMNIHLCHLKYASRSGAEVGEGAQRGWNRSWAAGRGLFLGPGYEGEEEEEEECGAEVDGGDQTAEKRIKFSARQLFTKNRLWWCS
ncbi:hypothetical protein GWI33_012232 [Rhynchophorus ferrugineus]|uniref:Uncharacterized protein n=1 Tax=Rhynchophorus ferrugineus TaxID=354439 RepID=A0A834IJ66_RHYFE|nr:hypothetical protein GWI33_012232 [Rhynchophorus ferrugineus]